MTEHLETEQQNFEEQIDDLITRINDLFNEKRNIINELKTIKRKHAKIVKKAVGLRNKKKKNETSKRSPGTGINKPLQVSEELSTFIKQELSDFLEENEKGDNKFSRSRVVKLISKYAKKHDLENEQDRRYLILERDGGEVLAKLFNISRDTEVKYIGGVQKYLKHHFS